MAPTYTPGVVCPHQRYHAERYLERSIDAAKARTDEEFGLVLESLKCDCLEYLTAEEVRAMEVVVRMPDNLQRELSVMRENRCRDGQPALIGRQLLAWGLRLFCRDEIRDKNTARAVMQSLRDSITKAALVRSQFRRSVQALESNLSLESAEDMSEAEILNILETLLDLVPDFAGHIELHREVSRIARSYHVLINRPKGLVDQDEEKPQRQQWEDACSS